MQDIEYGDKRFTVFNAVAANLLREAAYHKAASNYETALWLVSLALKVENGFILESEALEAHPALERAA